jgi:hypothetical protein
VDEQLRSFIQFLYEVKAVSEIALTVASITPIGAGTKLILATGKLAQLTKMQKVAVAASRFIIPVTYVLWDASHSANQLPTADIVTVTASSAAKSVPSLLTEQPIAEQADLLAASQQAAAADATATVRTAGTISEARNTELIRQYGTKGAPSAQARGATIVANYERARQVQQQQQAIAANQTAAAGRTRALATGANVILSGLTIWFFAESVTSTSEGLIQAVSNL